MPIITGIVWSSLPEALHQITSTMSERGIPASFRLIHSLVSHTYTFINFQSQLLSVKFHLVNQQGIKNLTDAEAAELVDRDRKSNQRD